MNLNYCCSVCGKQNVKLWRPYNDTTPLICATCAEERQSEIYYDEKVWEKRSDCFVGNPTGQKLILPKWEVDQNGKVPSPFGPGPEELDEEKTDQLIINLSDVSKNYISGETTVIPAMPDEDGNFWAYTAVPEDKVNWWENLPTR